MQCVGLDQDAIEIKRAEQLLERRLFTGLVGVIGGLGQRHAKGSGVDGDLGHEPVVAVFCLDGGASQGFPVTVTARKDDAPAAIQAANVNVAVVGSISDDGGLIQTTSG